MPAQSQANTTKVAFSAAAQKRAEALFARYPKKVHALLPLLHLAQEENGGWLPPGWEDYIADLTDTTVTHVRGVVTFYNMFTTNPVGKNRIEVCTCVPCGLCGGAEVLEHIEHKLGVGPGGTTEDGVFTLSEEQCLAICDKAPFIRINGNLHAKVSLKDVDQLLEDARKGKSGGK